MSEFASKPADDIDNLTKIAADWIERRDFGHWSEEDKGEFDRWLSASPAHRIAYLRLQAGWQRTELLGALRPFKSKPQKFARGSGALLLRLAAVFALVAIVGAGAAYYFAPQPKIYATGIGGRETLRLSDGTLVDMNTDTRIRLSGMRGERKVWLEKGEAYFQVRHDPAHPFVVMVGNRSVTDLGTEFLIREDPHRLEVALLEGRARFDSANGGSTKSVTLTPGKVVVATAHALAVTEKSQAALSDELGWRRGVLIFHHTTLADAASEFNRYNNSKIVLADAEVAKRMIGGAFTITDVHRFAVIVRDALGLKVQDRNGDIVISQ